MRAFLALPLPEPTIDALVRAQGSVPVGRAVPEDNLHLTLAFLGQCDAAVLETLHDLLCATRMPRPLIQFGGLGTFAEMERGLVFVAVAASDELTGLHAKVAQCARSAGAELPRRRFRPHVTLTRANRQPKGSARDQLATAIAHRVEVPGFTADRICLYQSHLASNGARHEVIADYPLG